MRILVDTNMMREIIMDHYSSPLHKLTPKNEEEYKTIIMDSESCIDNIKIFIKEKDGVIEDACFDGVACAISTASTDILCDMVVGKTIDQANYIIEQYENMIYEKEYDDSVLEELIAFMNTHKQASRIKCATIGFTGVSSIINKK
ncbi:MAG: SUF system NifU family Fe-S cluster assembly protein [Bacilli bacterium]|nr:SUF system NifU family Fe-S cluster assembly protein [Bacilli bacterium]